MEQYSNEIEPQLFDKGNGPLMKCCSTKMKNMITVSIFSMDPKLKNTNTIPVRIVII